MVTGRTVSLKHELWQAIEKVADKKKLSISRLMGNIVERDRNIKEELDKQGG